MGEIFRAGLCLCDDNHRRCQTTFVALPSWAIICGAFATEIGEMEILGRLSRG